MVPTHTTPDSTRNHTTREEINSLREALLRVVHSPYCFSANGIILGDFNQVQKNVLAKFESQLDKDKNFWEVKYTGSSSALSTKDNNQLERFD